MVNYRWAPVHAYRKFLATALWTAVEAIAFVWDTLHNCYVKIRIFVLFVIFCIGKNSFLFISWFMMLCWQVELSKEFGIPVESQIFWVWAKRQNGTYRPSRPLTWQEERAAVRGIPILNVVLAKTKINWTIITLLVPFCDINRNVKFRSLYWWMYALCHDI